MKRVIFLFLAFVGVVSPLMAQNTKGNDADYKVVEKIYVQNGSVYEGYISNQEPGSKITIEADCSTVIIDSSNVSDLTFEVKQIAYLPEALQVWLKENRKGETEIKVASFNVGKKHYKDVIILEQGTQYKFVSCAKTKYIVAWGQIVKTTKNYNYKGIVDVVTLKNGQQYKGCIVEQIIGRTIKIRTESGAVNSVKFGDILSLTTQVEGSKRWNFIPRLDEITLKNGQELKGFISSRMIGSHILFMNEGSDSEEKIDLSEIVRYQKIANPQFEKEAAAQESSFLWF